MTRMDLVGRKPFDVVNVQIEFGLYLHSRFNLFIQNVPFIFVEFFREHSDDAISPLALERKENNERILREANVQRVVTQSPIDLRVGHIKDSFERAALER